MNPAYVKHLLLPFPDVIGGILGVLMSKGLVIADVYCIIESNMICMLTNKINEDEAKKAKSTPSNAFLISQGGITHHTYLSTRSIETLNFSKTS